jgi:lipid-binding SYLF domain-containing protein
MTRTIPTRNAARWIGLVDLASLATATAPAFAQSEQDQLVRDAQTTFSNFVRDPDMTWFQRHLGDAKALLIAPKIVRAGWIFGGSGGRAVLFSRNAQNGRWSGPAFYNVGTASVGFQAGIDVSETVTLGGEASVAAGPIGAGANSDITADLVAFSRSKGVYGGLNLNGTVVSVADNWNQAYYGRSVTPPDILMTARAHNPQADQLGDAISRAAGGAKTSLR